VDHLKCWFCETEARGTCAFCGRWICKEHAEEGKTKIEASDALDARGARRYKKYYKIKNAIKCSACEVSYEKSKE